MHAVLAVPVVGLCAGAAAGLAWPDVPPGILMAMLAGWVLLALHATRVSRTGLVLVATCGAFLVGGSALSAHAWHRAWRTPLRVLFEAASHEAVVEAERSGRFMPEDPSVSLTIEGVIRDDAATTASGAVSLPVDAMWAGRTDRPPGPAGVAPNPVRGGVQLTVVGALAPASLPEWRAGRHVRVVAELRRVARYLDPGVFDQERAMARRGISLVGTVKSAALVEIVSRGTRADERAADVRAYTRRAILDSVGRWSRPAAAIVTAIVIGDRSALDVDVQRRLQEAGTYHVIAISGGNIAILATLTLAAFRVAGMLGRTAMLASAVFLVAYGFVVGGGASVERAVLMAVISLIGRAADLRSPLFQALLLAAGVLVLADPMSVADVASLLTFGATGAILATASVPRELPAPRLLSPVAAMLIASAAAEIVLLPISATYFSRLTVAGLVLNFGAIPLMAVAQLAGMLTVPLAAVWPWAAAWVGWCAYVGAEGLVRTSELVRVAPWVTWRVSPPGAVAVVIYYAAVLSAWYLWRHRRLAAHGEGTPSPRLRPRALALAAVASGVWIAVAPHRMLAGDGDGQLHVTFIDVGQGDAALVRFPHGLPMLIDAGGLPGARSFDIGDRVVGPVLRQAGVARLGTLLLTHGDADHVGGAASVMRDFHPWDVWDGVPVPPLAAMQRLRADASRSDIRWTTVQRTDRARVGDVELIVRHPTVPDWERQQSRNDDSVVLELRWRDVSFVFTGDIGREAEAEIFTAFERAPLRVVKVPHHGSASSSSDAFVRALNPDVAVISVGRANGFGHPAVDVLARYDNAGAAIFRTDRDGAITIDTDGTSLGVRTFTGRTVSVTARELNARTRAGPNAPQRTPRS